MTGRCTGVPVSWLRLERYQLGELAEDQRREVAEHLAACPACAACAASIEADEATALPPKIGREPARSQKSPVRRIFAVAASMAAAAAVALAFGHTWQTRSTEVASETSRVKGGSVAFTLVRDDGVRMVEASGVFRDGDRFKALVTCPPSMTARFDVAVFDAEGVSFPLSAGETQACGNDVPLPGAFRLTGPTGEKVCLVWDEDGSVDRETLRRTRTPVEGRSICKDLMPRP
jgi:hypothetical protein